MLRPSARRRRPALPQGALGALAALSVLSSWSAAGADGLGRVDVGTRAPDFSLRGADGVSHRLKDVGRRIAVLEWTSPVCPFTAAAYRTGAMQALQRLVRRRGGAWYAVDTAAQGAPGWIEPKSALARLAGLHAEVSAFLYDETGAVGRAYGARATPTIFIIDRTGVLRYEGALEVEGSNGGRRPVARQALEALLRGRPVAMPETQPVGCPVDY